MPSIRLVSPTKAVLDFDPETVKNLTKSLTYTDQQIVNTLLRHKRTLKALESKPDFFIGQMGSRVYNQKLWWYRQEIQKLSDQTTKTLVFNENGTFWTWSGLAKAVSQQTGAEIVREFDLPEPKLVPWHKVPKYDLRQYQKDAVEALLNNCDMGPTCIEVSTGGGKTMCARMVVKHFGLKTIVVTPSVSIFKQFYSDLERHFGKGKVGKFGDGSKKSDKLITVAIADSLVNATKDDPHWKNLQSNQVVITDELHLAAAETVVAVLTGVLAPAPYRFGVTATWMRNDGKDLLLEGMSGQPVYEIGIDTLVSQGFLAKPNVIMIEVGQNVPELPDPNENTRENLYYHPEVNKIAAELANLKVDQKKPVLILIDEIEQFNHLLPLLKHPVAFAHGTLTAKHKETIPEAYWASDTMALVEQFNEGKFPILIGTSAVATGTDFQAPEVGIYLVGGKSPIALLQGMGRMTRGGTNGVVSNPWTGEQKTEFEWYDFMVHTDSTRRHAEARMDTYLKFTKVRRQSFLG